MSYFKNYPTTNYKFGNETTSTQVQDIGAYVDLIDRVKDDVSYYEEYNLRDGDRPDQVSNYLYGSPDYHWIFYLLNDELKRRGWPLTRSRISDKAKEEYPNIVFTTRANLSEQFLAGSNIEGQSSGVTGNILRRRPDMGQIIIEKTPTNETFTGTPDTNSELDIELTTDHTFVNSSDWVVTNTTTNTVVTDHTILISTDKTEATISNLSFGFNYSIVAKILTNANFINGETILATEDEVDKNIVIDKVVDEYNAKHHYEGSDGNYVDIAPQAPFIQRVSYEITWAGNASVLAAEFYSNPLSTELTGDKFVIDKINISNLSSIYTNFSLDEVTTQSVLGNLIPGGSALLIGGALQQQFNNDDSYTIADWSNNFLVGVLGIDEAFSTVIAFQLGAIINSIGQAGGTPPTSFVYHTFTLVDNQLNLYGATSSVPQYLGFEFRSDVNANVQTSSPFYAALAFDDIEANSPDDEDERNFVVYSNLGNTGTLISQSPFISNKTIDNTLDNNASFVFVQNEFENYISTNYDALVPATITPVTFLERYEKENEEVRTIKVLRPEIVVSFYNEFKGILSETSAEEISVSTGSFFGDTSFTSTTSNTTTTTTTTTSSSSSSSSGSSGGGGGSSY